MSLWGLPEEQMLRPQSALGNRRCAFMIS